MKTRPRTHMPTQIANHLADAIDELLQDAIQQQTMDEMMGAKDVSWRALLLRIPQEKLETHILSLIDASSEHEEYYLNDMRDVPPTASCL